MESAISCENKHSVNTERIEKAMRMFGLQEYGKQKVKRYSLGIKQRLAICQAGYGGSKGYSVG